jgi:hypothetical protein
MVDSMESTQAPAQAADRMTAAMAALDSVEAAPVETPPAETPGTQEPEAPPADKEPETGDRGELWHRLAERDREIRRLKQSAKSDVRELARTDPLAALRELGIGLDQAFDLLAGQARPMEPEAPQDEGSEVAKLRERLERFEQEQQRRAHEEVVSRERDKIRDLAAKDSERWELIHSLTSEGSIEKVLETAAEVYKLTGELPGYDVVMDTVEEDLEQVLSERYERMNKLRKLQAKFSMGKSMGEAKRLLEEPTAPAPTLSTGMAGGPAPRSFTEQERMAKALALLEGKGD